MTYRCSMILVFLAVVLAAQTSHAAPKKRPARAEAAKTNMLAGAHILISYRGARRARAGVTRSKAQALRLAKRLLARLRKSPKRFAALARKYSDGPTAKRGGFLGAWRRGRMVPAFDNAIGSIKIGTIAGPVETPFGYHVMQRLPLPPYFAGRHILISYVGATRARPSVTRTKAQARAFARKLSKKLKKRPQQFVAMAKKHSDGPSGKRGGSLGTWRKGRMVPAFDSAIEKLKIGQVSGVVATKFGYHIIKRERPKPKTP